MKSLADYPTALEQTLRDLARAHALLLRCLERLRHDGPTVIGEGAVVVLCEAGCLACAVEREVQNQ